MDEPKNAGKGEDYEFRTVTDEDLARERAAESYVSQHLAVWQTEGWIPDMRIEVGGPPRYQGLDFIRARGWTYWHHLFNPRQLLLAALVNQFSDAKLKFGFAQVLNNNCRASRWHPGAGPGATVGIFDNQPLSTIFNYGCRGSQYAAGFLQQSYKTFPFSSVQRLMVESVPADQTQIESDIYVTDPPYGDAVKYEEILDFFIAWLRRRPPKEFSNWTWDSRRSLAIKGEDEDFRRDTVSAYTRMRERMPENGMQVIMFTHQSGTIWADMANIVWASGLRATLGGHPKPANEGHLKTGQ
jgi:putative DNA methylase